MFQSAPGFGAGGNLEPLIGRAASKPFQSAPGFGAGGNHAIAVARAAQQVSIRPRLWGRGKPRSIKVRLYFVSFNPPPALGPGETTTLGVSQIDLASFNPPPALGPGETCSAMRCSRSGVSFNPPPALGPGETDGESQPPGFEPVSIRPRLWGRGKPGGTSPFVPRILFQSAPGFGAGGNQTDGHTLPGEC